jgi:DNA-binding transcriptional ArsR family regulator
MALVEEPDRVRVALSPLRRQLLDRLHNPASAAQLAAELELPRQRVNYHLRTLEKAGLIELVEERPRRGCTERIMQTTAGSFVVDPSVMGVAGDSDAARLRAGDTYAAGYLVDVAADTVRNVARMRASADQAGTRLLTFTIETQVQFAEPVDVHRFTDALCAAVSDTVAEFDTPGGRPYRLIVGGHPAPRPHTRGVEP